MDLTSRRPATSTVGRRSSSSSWRWSVRHRQRVPSHVTRAQPEKNSPLHIGSHRNFRPTSDFLHHAQLTHAATTPLRINHHNGQGGTREDRSDHWSEPRPRTLKSPFYETNRKAEVESKSEAKGHACNIYRWKHTYMDGCQEHGAVSPPGGSLPARFRGFDLGFSFVNKAMADDGR